MRDFFFVGAPGGTEILLGGGGGTCPPSYAPGRKVQFNVITDEVSSQNGLNYIFGREKMRLGHHRIIQNNAFRIIPIAHLILIIMVYFLGYDQQYHIFCYYFLYISAALIANISN